jgi:hypothetical protein
MTPFEKSKFEGSPVILPPHLIRKKSVHRRTHPSDYLTPNKSNKKKKPTMAVPPAPPRPYNRNPIRDLWPNEVLDLTRNSELIVREYTGGGDNLIDLTRPVYMRPRPSPPPPPPLTLHSPSPLTRTRTLRSPRSVTDFANEATVEEVIDLTGGANELIVTIDGVRINSRDVLEIDLTGED